MINAFNVDDVLNHISKQKEDLLLDQLSDLVSRGLLVIESTQPVLVREFENCDKITIKQSIKLSLKDKEYILQLEEENKKLKSALELIKGALSE